MVRKTGQGVTIVGVFALAWCGALASSSDQVTVEIRIHAPTLVTALLQFSQQTGLQLVLPLNNDSAQRKAPVIDGMFTPKDALEALLRESGLTYTFVNARTISVSTISTRSRSQTAVAPP